MSNENLDKTWHLIPNEEQMALTNFEHLLWRLFYSFSRWQEDCQARTEIDLTANEVALVHIVRIKDRPKTIYEIARIINRDDIPNIQYSVTKLQKLGLIKKVASTYKGS